MKAKALYECYSKRTTKTCRQIRGDGDRVSPDGGDPEELIEVLEEDDLINPYKTGLTEKEKAYRKARAQMARKTSKHEKGYLWRLGYHACTGQYSPSGDYPDLSGSSMNRKKRLQKKRPRTDSLQVTHKLSNRSKGKVKDKATALYRSVKKDRIFLTLTFIQHIPDRVGAKILNKFLTVLRRDSPGTEYIWVAEHQPERDTHTIHFHILLNKRLAIRRYNALWIMQQYNEGLRGQKDGREVCIEEMRAAFHAGVAHKYFNPADVEPAHSITGLASYLTKYMTKQTHDEEFGCLTWHCSRKVSKLFTRAIVGPSTFSYLMSFDNYKVNHKTGECSPAKWLRGQFHLVVFVNNRPRMLPKLRQLERINELIMDGFDVDIGNVVRLDDEFYRSTVT